MPLRNYILNNWGLKLAALGFATMIWLAINSSLQKEIKVPRDSVRTDPTREFPKRPISVLASAGDRRIFRVVPDEATVKVSGAIVLLERLKAEDIQPFVRLTAGQEPRGPFAVQVYLPPGISLVTVLPKAANLETVKQP